MNPLKLRKCLLGRCALLATLLLSGCSTVTRDGPAPIRPQPEKAAKTYYELGVAYMKNGRYDLAELKLQRSLEKRPSPDAYNALALLYETQHENALAEEIYQTLIAKYPAYERGYSNYNFFLCKYDRQSQIEQLARQMAAQGGRVATVGRIAAGDCAMRKKAINRAEMHYKEALKYDPHVAGALLPLAEIDLERGNVAEAKIKINQVHNYVGYSARSVYLSILVSRELGDELEERKMKSVLRSQFAGSPEAKEIFRN